MDPKPQSEKTPTPEELQAQVEKLQAQLQEEQKIRSDVLADPDFASLLKAKQSNKSVKIVSEDELEKAPEKKSLKDAFGLNPQKQTATSVEDLDRLPNSKLMDILADSIEDYVSSALSGTLDSATKVLDKRFAVIEDTQNKIKNAIIEQAKTTSSATMASRYPDFNQYAEEAFKVSQTTALNLEDAYLLVKAKKRGLAPEVSEVETERPATVPTRMRNRQPAENNPTETPERPASNHRGFRMALSSAFDRASRRQDFSR